MAPVKRMSEEAAKRVDELAEEAGVSVARFLSVLVRDHGEQARDTAARERLEVEALERRHREGRAA